MEAKEIGTMKRQGLLMAFSLMAGEERNNSKNIQTDPNDPAKRGEEIDPTIPTEGEEGHQGPDSSPDDLEHQLPEHPDERREDRERGGDSPLDDMKVPIDPNGKNVG